MDTPRFLLTLVVGLVGAAGCLVLAEALDLPALRFVAVALILGVFAGRELWAWRGHGRAWLATVGLLLAVVGLAFALQRLAS